MKVLITGATGMIGQEIVKRCRTSGIAVNYLTTSKDKLTDSPDYKGFYWNPYQGEIDDTCFKEVEVIIHLVGASIAKRWTNSYKNTIIKSRTETTALLVQRLSEIKHSVRQVVSASAVGIYPDSLQKYYTEEHTEVANNFLGEVVALWETAVDQFKTLAIDVAKIRIGLVLSQKGGAYPKISTPVKYGVGAAFGSGKQWQSWIHINDLASIFMYVFKEELEGVYNAVAANPVSNEKLTETIAEVVDKNLILPNIPKFAMKLVLGEMHIVLFGSQRVSCAKIISAGYQFEFDHVIHAIRNLEEEN
ncbi:TIGR01777 family oxidoreductase [Aquimarina sp. ERC-38]|uniref:TIGR01777 family oxidoreductase n=1 Tax=Aquimarina sp. ERC-38 TaxID=2949996 RepID=UPI002246120B|nr:TIGR01777 family oxidoreductase [Aquimarina sp. ERC-38]UZO80915.1 TIGR01777 family oxidoreductase [Aquimarina sp. ERC-38]